MPTITMNATDALDLNAHRATLVPGFTTGALRLLLRLEGLAMLLIAVSGYRALGGTWGIFAACFFLPDLSMLGYLIGPRSGAVLYNIGHSLIGPTLLAALAFAAGAFTPLCLVALIWVAHIGFDRMAGYGLKYASSFFDTHLGRVGKAKA